MKEIKVRITFTEPILGTSPANPDVYREFIGSKSPDALNILRTKLPRWALMPWRKRP